MSVRARIANERGERAKSALTIKRRGQELASRTHHYITTSLLYARTHSDYRYLHTFMLLLYAYILIDFTASEVFPVLLYTRSTFVLKKEALIGQKAKFRAKFRAKTAQTSLTLTLTRTRTSVLSK